MKTTALAAMAMVLTAWMWERTAEACLPPPCQPVVLGFDGKTLPGALNALPLGSIYQGVERSAVLRRGETTIKGRVDVNLVNFEGMFLLDEPLAPGDYELASPQLCSKAADGIGRTKFTVAEERPHPKSTGSLRANVRFIPKIRPADPKPPSFNTCGSVDDPETYDRAVAEITLDVAPDLVPYLPIATLDAEMSFPNVASTGAFRYGSPGLVTEPIFTRTVEVRCDELRLKFASQPGKYTYSYAARLPREEALPPTSVSFELLCPATAKTPIWDENGRPVPQPTNASAGDGDGCAVRAPGGPLPIASGAWLFGACVVAASLRRRSRTTLTMVKRVVAE